MAWIQIALSCLILILPHPVSLFLPSDPKQWWSAAASSHGSGVPVAAALVRERLAAWIPAAARARAAPASRQRRLRRGSRRRGDGASSAACGGGGSRLLPSLDDSSAVGFLLLPAKTRFLRWLPLPSRTGAAGRLLHLQPAPRTSHANEVHQLASVGAAPPTVRTSPLHDCTTI